MDNVAHSGGRSLISAIRSLGLGVERDWRIILATQFEAADRPAFRDELTQQGIPMRIDKIYLKQVGPFDEVRIPLTPGTNPDLADVYLLVGPNGSGKSTVLYSVASIVRQGNQTLGRDLGAPRLRSVDSVSAIAFGELHCAAKWFRAGNEISAFAERQAMRVEKRQLTGTKGPSSIEDPFGGGELERTEIAENIEYYSSLGTSPIKRYWAFRTEGPADSRSRCSWAAFAFAGMRSVTEAKVKAIQEVTEGPFHQSLSFLETADTQRLAQWIAYQEYKRLKAKEAGRMERAAEFEKSIRDIERVIAEIIEQDFAFVTSEEDNNVRVCMNGSVIDLGLLPDGLKSIVSWVADLLMRLDRIPWVDDTPPMQRSFLLLLDEIDIHLHPAWQRKVLPIVQRMFPKAQIIASTHSPFVVASAEDAQIINLIVEHGVARVAEILPSQSGLSYSTILRLVFGINSEFTVETEGKFAEFRAARKELLSGATSDRANVERLAANLAARSEEIEQLVAMEMRQIDRQLALRSAS